MTDNLVQVENTSFVRDIHSKAILNTDRVGLHNYHVQKELHKKEHFDVVDKYIYYRNDVNRNGINDDKSNLSTEIVNEYDVDGLNITNLFTLRFTEKRGFILHFDGQIEQY